MFDEAHNITKFCEDGYTFSLPASVLNSAQDTLENTPAAGKCQEICSFLEEFYDYEYQSSFFEFFESSFSGEDVKELSSGAGSVYNAALGHFISFLQTVLDIIGRLSSYIIIHCYW